MSFRSSDALCRCHERSLLCKTKERTVLQRCKLFARDLQRALPLEATCLQCPLRMRDAYRAILVYIRREASRAAYAIFSGKAYAFHGNRLSGGATHLLILKYCTVPRSYASPKWNVWKVLAYSMRKPTYEISIAIGVGAGLGGTKHNVYSIAVTSRAYRRSPCVSVAAPPMAPHAVPVLGTSRPSQ